jgi:hypothetical protein
LLQLWAHPRLLWSSPNRTAIMFYLFYSETAAIGITNVYDEMKKTKRHNISCRFEIPSGHELRRRCVFYLGVGKVVRRDWLRVRTVYVPSSGVYERISPNKWAPRLNTFHAFSNKKVKFFLFVFFCGNHQSPLLKPNK